MQVPRPGQTDLVLLSEEDTSSLAHLANCDSSPVHIAFIFSASAVRCDASSMRQYFFEV